MGIFLKILKMKNNFFLLFLFFLSNVILPIQMNLFSEAFLCKAKARKKKVLFGAGIAGLGSFLLWFLYCRMQSKKKPAPKLPISDVIKTKKEQSILQEHKKKVILESVKFQHGNQKEFAIKEKKYHKEAIKSSIVEEFIEPKIDVLPLLEQKKSILDSSSKRINYLETQEQEMVTYKKRSISTEMSLHQEDEQPCEDKSKNLSQSVILLKKFSKGLLDFNDILYISEAIPYDFYKGEFNSYYDRYDRTYSLLYNIIGKNDDKFIDEIVLKKNVYDVITMFHDEISEFITKVKDMRLFGLLYYKINFFDPGTIRADDAVPFPMCNEIYYRWIYQKNQFDESFDQFICSSVPQLIQEQLNKDVFQYLEKTKINYEGKNGENIGWTNVFLEFFWRKMYAATEKRYYDVDQGQTTALLYNYLEKNLDYVDNPTVFMLAQKDTPTSQRFLGLIGKNYQNTFVNRADLLRTCKGPIGGPYCFSDADFHRKRNVHNNILIYTGWDAESPEQN